MRQFISFLFALFFIIQPPLAQNRSYKIRTIAFFNVENLFDTINNPSTFDEDFTPQGKNHYNSAVYQKKILNISRVLSEIGKEKTKTSPAIIALSEIENDTVLKDLIHSPPLKDQHYQIIHYNSPDIRGIDVALLYKQEIFKPLEQESTEVKLWDDEGKRIYTRNILTVKGFLDDELIYMIVNHWPSRRGGQQRSSTKREKAAFVVQKIIDGIREEDKNARIIVLGDFNDDPVDKSIKTLNSTGNLKDLDKSSLYNPMEILYHKGYNTLSHRDGLNLFDQIMMSYRFISPYKDYKNYQFYQAGIYNPDYLITQTGKYRGYPFRSFQNNTFTGGYSDHFPVFIYLIKENDQRSGI